MSVARPSPFDTSSSVASFCAILVEHPTHARAGRRRAPARERSRWIADRELADDRRAGRRRVRRSGGGAVGRLLQPEGDLAEGDDVAGADAGAVDARAVHERPVARAEVAHRHAVVGALDLGVPPRDRRVDDRDVAVGRSADDERRAGAQLERLQCRRWT